MGLAWCKSPLEQGATEGDNPVCGTVLGAVNRCVFKESSCLGMQLKMGGKFHLRLNIGERPIANKYREGKMKRTLKRELKVLEIVKREAIGRLSIARHVTFSSRALGFRSV